MFWKFFEIKNMVLLSKKVDGNIIFTSYWKVLVLTFSEMGNTVFSWAKKLTEIWYLLESPCFELFGDWKYGLFLSQEVDGKMIFTGYWEVLVLNFSMMGNTVFFFSQKTDGKIIFTWSFWAFYDTPGPGKYGFSRSVLTKIRVGP